MRVEQKYNHEMEALKTVRQSQLKVILDRKQKDIKENNPAQNTEISKEELKKIIEEIRRKMDYLNKYLRIDIDNELEIPVIKVVEKETEKVIRQIPPDYMLTVMKRIDEMLGILINERI